MQVINLQYIPTGSIPVVHVSQNDIGRQFQLALYDGTSAYSMPAGTTARVEGIKPDKKGFSYTDAVSVSGNTVTVTTKQQMTIVSGVVECEIRFSKDGTDIGTLNFKMIVEPSPINEDTDISETVLPIYMEAGHQYMLGSEAWAKGTKDGVAVGSDQPQYHANSKYYSEQAASSASTATTKASQASTSATNAANSATASANSATTSSNKALVSEGYASGTQSGSAVGSSSPYYHNNSKYYSEQAQASADAAASWSAHPPYIGANGNWWIWNTTTQQFVDSGIDASITVAIADITMLEPTATPYVTNTGTNTDPIFHLFIPRGKGIASLNKTNTNVLVDTYTITYSDGATTTFTVTNGRGINTISKTSTVGLVDTYTIAYNDNTTSTFTVTNGKTAYQSAVEGGYSGTEAEFEADLANFEEWKDDAETAASNASASAISAAGSVTQAHQEYLDAKNQADRAQAYADFIEPHFIIQDNRLYIKDDSSADFVVADNRLYMKLTA